MSLGDELSSINFESMIGGPLSAVITAQAQAAVTSKDCGSGRRSQVAGKTHWPGNQHRRVGMPEMVKQERP